MSLFVAVVLVAAGSASAGSSMAAGMAGGASGASLTGTHDACLDAVAAGSVCAHEDRHEVQIQSSCTSSSCAALPATFDGSAATGEAPILRAGPADDDMLQAARPLRLERPPKETL